MPLPQLNTNIDYSNALYKLAESERQRQEQADISQNRNLQTQSLLESRESENALRQIQMNREQAALENTKLDTVYKMLATADPASEEDWKAFSAFSDKTSGTKVPVPYKSDGTFDTDVATRWRDNKLDAIAYMKTGNKDIDQIYLQKDNPDGTFETLIHYAKKKDKTNFNPEKEYGKGWKVVDKFTNPQELEEKKAAREARIAAQKDPSRFAPQRVEAEDADGNTVILSFPAGQTVTQADIERSLGPGATISSSTDKKRKPFEWEETATKIAINADKIEAVAPLADAYNMEAPGNKVYVPVTYSVPIGDNRYVPGTRETKYEVKTLPKISNHQITKKDVAAYAKKNNLSYNDALNFILIAGAKSK
jgi:hypothetical protein